MLAIEQNEQNARNQRADDPRAIRVALARSALNVAAQRAAARRDISPNMASEIVEDFDWVVSSKLRQFDEDDSIYNTELEAIAGAFFAATRRNVEMFGTMSLDEAREIEARAKGVFQEGARLDMSDQAGWFSSLPGRMVQNVTNIIGSNIHQNDPRELDAADRQ